MIKHTDISSLKGLANFLRCQEKELESLLNNKIIIIDKGSEHHDINDMYRDLIMNNTRDAIILHKLYIPKKNSNLGHRVVYSIKNHLFSSILKTLNTYLKEIYLPEENVHGFINNRNIKTNATQHLSKRKLMSVDIENFFETISTDMINKSFISLGFTPEISPIISQLITLNGRLAQGYHTSPTIANIVASSLDKELLKEVCLDDIIYTRYADDLYFSSNKELPLLDSIEKIINKHGFKLNPNKTKYMPRGSKQYVTGLSVFDKNSPRIPKRIKKALRLEVYYINKWGMKSHLLKKLGYSYNDYSSNILVRHEVDTEHDKSYARIYGWIKFIMSIEYKVGKKLENQL